MRQSGIAREPAAEGGAGQRVGRPARLPRREEGARRAAQLGPCAPVAPLRRAQHGRSPGQRKGGGDGPEEARKTQESSGTTSPRRSVAAQALGHSSAISSARPGRAPSGSADAEEPWRPRTPQPRRPRRYAAISSCSRAAGRTPACASPAARSARSCLPSDISSPALSCARARCSSSAVSPSRSRRISSHSAGISSAGLVLAGAGIDAEHAAVAIGVGEGIDRIDEAALLADLLEEARGHAAAERGRHDRGGVIIVIGEGEAGEAQQDMRPARDRALARDRRRHSARARSARRLARGRCEKARCARSTIAPCIEIAGRDQHHAGRGVVAPGCSSATVVAVDAADDLGAAQHRPAHRLIGKGALLEQIEDDVVGRVVRPGRSPAAPPRARARARAASKVECCRMSARISTASGDVLLQHLGVIGGVLARGIGVDVAADRLDLGGDLERASGAPCP